MSMGDFGLSVGDPGVNNAGGEETAKGEVGVDSDAGVGEAEEESPFSLLLFSLLSLSSSLFPLLGIDGNGVLFSEESDWDDEEADVDAVVVVVVAVVGRGEDS